MTPRRLPASIRLLVACAVLGCTMDSTGTGHEASEGREGTESSGGEAEAESGSGSSASGSTTSGASSSGSTGGEDSSSTTTGSEDGSSSTSSATSDGSEASSSSGGEETSSSASSGTETSEGSATSSTSESSTGVETTEGVGPTSAETGAETSTSTGTDTGVGTTTTTSTGTGTDTGDPGPDPEPPLLRIAVIGDYGLAGPGEAAVAELVHSWSPDAVMTVGDNNYPSGAASTIDDNVGQYFSQYIGDYAGEYGDGADDNRFFPTLGNHDWIALGAQPYLDYFTLPGNERYYSVTLGPTEWFALDSDDQEADGNTAASDQAAWLQQALAESTATWKVVFFHHAPYSSGSEHGDTPDLQWPFSAWGADLVLAGHDHDYERLEVDGIPYLVNGLGGGSLRSLGETAPESLIRFVHAFGALKIEIWDAMIVAEFVTVEGHVVDRVQLGGTQPERIEWTDFGASWRYLDDGMPPLADWIDPDFDDSAWAEGLAPLGYGDPGIETTVSYGDDTADRHRTTWFRGELDVEDAGSFTDLRLSLVHDDGAVVYLNGVEVFRTTMPTGPVDDQTLATRAVGGFDEPNPETAVLPATALVEGRNVIAVEIHQSGPDSTDVRFDLALAGERP